MELKRSISELQGEQAVKAVKEKLLEEKVQERPLQLAEEEKSLREEINVLKIENNHLTLVG